MKIQERIGIGTNGIECHIAQVKESGETDNDIQSKTQHYIDERRNHYVGLIQGEHERKRKGEYTHDDQGGRVNFLVFQNVLGESLRLSQPFSVHTPGVSEGTATEWRGKNCPPQ